MDRAQRLLETQRSWNFATRAHNAHKRDQASFFRDGGSTLFSEELELLGPLPGRRLLHTLCNSGQDTLSLARQGAETVGVDLSDEAIGFAQDLAKSSGISATFLQSEALAFLHGPLEPTPFDLVFGSYGCLAWLDDLEAYFQGIAKRLKLGGRVVIVEFHPMAWSFDAGFGLCDSYFAPDHLYSQPVGDYVGAASGALSPSGHVASEAPYVNPHLAHAFQHTVSDVVCAVLAAGLELETLREWPYANGCRLCPGLVPRPEDPRRFTTPE